MTSWDRATADEIYDDIRRAWDRLLDAARPLPPGTCVNCLRDYAAHLPDMLCPPSVGP